jgi:hypothetical protein
MSMHHLDNRELGTVLAALRVWQGMGQVSQSIQDIATDGGTIEPLNNEEIDALCERINGEPAPVVKVRVSGGVVQNVETPAGVTAQVFDYDVDGADVTTLDEDEQGDDCTIATYGEQQ